MKRRRRRQRQLEQRNREAALLRREAARRGGSTLMIVIALLAMLSLVGVVFYTFAAQERSNAEYFAYARKAEADNGQPGDVFFDWALRQLIVGPENYERQSSLWGKSHSMIPNMFGRDAHPYTGAGVHLILDGNGGLVVDQDYDGDADDGGGPPGNERANNSDLLQFNISPAARVFLDSNGDPDYSNVVRYDNGYLINPSSINNRWRFPHDIDVGYTYPDINNLFISYDGKGLDRNNSNAATRFRRVIIPSFHRPQYLRDSNGNVIYDWYENSNTATRVLRPHPNHVNVVDGTARFFGLDGVRGGGDDFPFKPLDNLGMPTTGKMGVWTDWNDDGQDNNYQLDVDNDGDGAIREGVWLDLGYPVQQLADGTEYITLFSMTVIDADALLNMNVHGNTRQLADIGVDSPSPFGQGRFLSKSNQGRDPGEVNLQYAFHANPAANSWDFSGDAAALTTALEQYRLFFGRDPQSRQELSNMEYWFLTRGRAEFSSSGGTQADVTDLYPGRYGEPLTTLYDAIRVNAGGSMFPRNFPQPDRGGINDQGSADPNRDNPQFGHPLANNGRGWYWNLRSGGTPRRPTLVQAQGANNPSAWLGYQNYQLRSTFYPRWGNVLGNQLMGNASRDAQIDDAMELVVERDVLRSTDAVFGPEETAYAQLSINDRDTINVTPRIEELMSFSFKAVETASRQAASKRLTAQSWDRKHFGFSRYFIGNRSWEFNRDGNNDGNANAFPPTFRPADWDDNSPPSRFPTAPNSTTINEEPFRDALTLLLSVVNESTRRGRPQFRINLNRYLYSPRPGFLAYRQLTDPANNWQLAQRDRQKMCRDIYVMLYTLGGGNDNTNYADMNDHSNTMTIGVNDDFVYTRPQLRQMAQFAVNLVDSMDRDTVITKFEYDKNLGKTVDVNDDTSILRGGWNLDDDPRTNDGFAALPSNDANRDADYPEDSIERGVVYGVEAQQLTFSEGMWARVKGDANSSVMLYDEMDGIHDHLFIELRNASPFTVPMAHNTDSLTADEGKWRIRINFNASATGVPGPAHILTFLKNAKSVSAGGQFTIGASNAKDQFPDPANTGQIGYRPADLRVDYDLDGDFDLIAPALQGDNPPSQDTPESAFPSPWTDLDLVHKRDELLEFAIGTDISPLKGSLFLGVDDTTFGFKMVLERRADLDRPTLSPTDNPWVEVDRMDVLGDFLAFNSVNSMAEVDIKLELKKAKSNERVQPFAKGQRGSGGDTEPKFNDNLMPPPPGVTLGVQYNTIKAERNSQSPSKFTLWQQHFDRDFASVGELLGVPLYGPNKVTKYAGGSQNSLNSTPRHHPPRQEYGLTSRPYPLTAASLMLQPQHPSTLPPAAANPQRDNRWYRLLEFVEVPTRTHLALGNPLNISRVPGRMNPNMMRNPESLAGLIDDSNIFNFGANYLGDPTSGYAPLRGAQEGTTRDWWEQLIRARDRRDPVTGLYLPGTSSSRPFRSLSFLGDGNNSIEHTLLRQLPNDESNGNSNRRLLEIGNRTEHQNGSVDPYIRHQLLSKVWGNTTTRSHVFVVFISVGYFEAKDMGNEAARIGKQLVHGTDLDGTEIEHRGVFVVNRSRIEEAVKQGTNKVSWRKLVDFRQTIK
jgi:hypothetical protein